MNDSWIIQKRIDPIRRIWPIMIFQIYAIWTMVFAIYLRFHLHLWPILFLQYGFSFNDFIYLYIGMNAFLIYYEAEILYGY